MTNKEADKEYILDEERKFLGGEVGDFFIEPETEIAGYETIEVELLQPTTEQSYIDWVNSAFYSSLATWDRAPFNVVSNMNKELSFEEKEKKLFNILKERPISVALEGASFTFRITGVPRSMTAQICRHRSMAFGEMSMRVASAYSETVRAPQTLLEAEANLKNIELLSKYKDIVKSCRKIYKELIENGVPMEQARNIMPLGTCTKIGATMRLRHMIDYIRGRTSGIAQDEHTYIVALLINELKTKQPKFYDVVKMFAKNIEEILEKYLKKW